LHIGITTDANEVIGHFAGSARARQALADWKRERPEVAQHVLGHVTLVPYATNSAELRRVVQTTEHALGEVKRLEIMEVTSIRDWNPQFAMTHVLHYTLEQLGKPFTYQQFRKFCRDDSLARSMLTGPSQEAVARATKQHGPRLAIDAMRWRIGNSYYSFLRELIAVVSLREAGIDLRVHPLADALFRTDAWVSNCVLSLYIGNSGFRNGPSGRKPRPKDLLGESFNYVDVNLQTQNTFGSLHVPAAKALRDAAEQILRETSKSTNRWPD